jgi:LuxR family maltose regulon positive regulatory protein
MRCQPALRLCPARPVSGGRGLILASNEALEAGQLDAAQRFALEARALCEAALNREGTRAAMMTHGLICYEQGQLHQSFHLFQQVLAKLPGDNQYGSISDRAYVYWALGAVEYEWNDLEAAAQHAAEAARIGKRSRDKRLEVHATILLARIEHAHGRSEHAQHLLETVIPIASNPDLFWRVQVWQAQLALAGNHLPLVELWRARWTWRQETELSPVLIEQEMLLTARLHLLDERPEAALELLDVRRAEVHAAGWARAELETLLLMVWAYYLQGDRTRTHTVLSRALALAQPENMRRPFLNEGEPLVAAIRAVLSDIQDKRLLSFARTLLAAYAQTGTRTEVAAIPLLDPLSAQERRVLRLLAAGLSNGEIAQELVVSTNTIKSQLKNIFRKLNVKSRQEAREAAHDFHLL